MPVAITTIGGSAGEPVAAPLGSTGFECPASRRPYHTLLTGQGTVYNGWQSRIMRRRDTTPGIAATAIHAAVVGGVAVGGVSASVPWTVHRHHTGPHGGSQYVHMGPWIRRGAQRMPCVAHASA